MNRNASRIAIRLVRGWNLPPGTRPGDESPPEPVWHGASAEEVYEGSDPEELDRVMKAAISEDAYEDLDEDQVEELASGGYYSPVSVELDWDSATLHFERGEKPTDIGGAPELFSVRIRNPFVD